MPMEEDLMWDHPQILPNDHPVQQLNNEASQLQVDQWVGKHQSSWSLDLENVDPPQSVSPQPIPQHMLGGFPPNPPANDADLTAVRDLFLSALEPAGPLSEPGLSPQRSLDNAMLYLHTRSSSQEGMLQGKYSTVPRSTMSPIVKHHFNKQGHTNFGRPMVGLVPMPGPMGLVPSGSLGGSELPDSFMRSVGSISDSSQSQPAFAFTPNDNFSATHTNGFALASPDGSLSSSFRHRESAGRVLGTEKRMNAAATYTSGILNPIQVGCISVVDPQRRKLQLPGSIIRHTRALGSRITTPSLCLLYQSGRCRQGSNCYQVHADPNAVAALRAKAERQLCCCSVHGDANVHMWNVAAHAHRSISIGRAIIPLDHVAFTAGLQRVLTDNRLTVPVNPSLLCRLQEQPSSCRYGADCKFLHVCREILNANANAEPEESSNPSTAPTRASANSNGGAGDFSASLNCSLALGSESSSRRFTAAVPQPFVASAQPQMIPSPVQSAGPLQQSPSMVQQQTIFIQGQVPNGLPGQPQFLLRQVNCDGSVTFVPVNIFQDPMATVPAS